MNIDGNWLAWWGHADVVVKGVFITLLVASLATWSVFFLKLTQLFNWSRAERKANRLLATEELQSLVKLPIDAPTRLLYLSATRLTLRRQTNATEMRERLDAVQCTIRVEQERLLTILATVGSSAPFIGLLGTVWGIMNALQTLAGKALTLEAVAGPVGEALIATAIGLFAAIPALIAYNALLRWLRGINAITAANARELIDQLFIEPA